MPSSGPNESVTRSGLGPASTLVATQEREHTSTHTHPVACKRRKTGMHNAHSSHCWCKPPRLHPAAASTTTYRLPSAAIMESRRGPLARAAAASAVVTRSGEQQLERPSPHAQSCHPPIQSRRHPRAVVDTRTSTTRIRCFITLCTTRARVCSAQQRSKQRSGGAKTRCPSRSTHDKGINPASP